jgi:hypothetical protein
MKLGSHKVKSITTPILILFIISGLSGVGLLGTQQAEAHQDPAPSIAFPAGCTGTAESLGLHAFHDAAMTLPFSGSAHQGDTIFYHGEYDYNPTAPVGVQNCNYGSGSSKVIKPDGTFEAPIIIGCVTGAAGGIAPCVGVNTAQFDETTQAYIADCRNAQGGLLVASLVYSSGFAHTALTDIDFQTGSQVSAIPIVGCSIPVGGVIVPVDSASLMLLGLSSQPSLLLLGLAPLAAVFTVAYKLRKKNNQQD